MYYRISRYLLCLAPLCLSVAGLGQVSLYGNFWYIDFPELDAGGYSYPGKVPIDLVDLNYVPLSFGGAPHYLAAGESTDLPPG